MELFSMWIPICLMSLFLGQDENIDVQESLRVEFVTLDILALDKKGQPVTDLKLSTFIKRCPLRYETLLIFVTNS